MGAADHEELLSRIDAVLRHLLQASHLLAPGDLNALVVDELLGAGFTEANMWLADLEQRTLVALPPAEAVGLPIDTSVAGRAYQHEAPVVVEAGPSQQRVWLPMRDGTERLGVLSLVHDTFDDVLVDRCSLVATLAAELVVSKMQYGDGMVRRGRLRELSLAAELRWTILPPRTFATPDVAIACSLQPAYDVAGDGFDYALDDSLLKFAVFDAKGHALGAARMANLAIAGYRHCRRRGATIEECADAVDQAVALDDDDEAFVTGVLGELDSRTGAVRVVCAGHPMPLVLRDNRSASEIRVPVTLPFGLGERAEPGDVQLQPGDRLILFSDGLIEVRDEHGHEFGRDGLVDMIVRATEEQFSSSEAVRRVMREVLDHLPGALTDDATLVVVTWKGPASD